MIGAAQKSALERALGDAVEFDVPMARHTSLRIGGPADAVATPASRDDLATLLDLCEQHQLPTLSIGAGFNLLVSDAGIDGVVIRLSRFRRLEQRSRTAVFAEAGVTHASLTRFCVERGLSGLEFGAGIPGVVGGWVTMNAGIGTREVVDVALEVEIVGPGREPARILTRDELDFSYRSFRNLPLGAVVVSVLFEVTPAEPDDVRSEVDRLLAQRARTQPLNIPSCGSVFKNPQGDFAGRLIEAAGLKGEREGGAQISPLHANFIANTGGATAADVQRLMERAREAVEKSSGVRLEPEVRIVGRTA